MPPHCPPLGVSLACAAHLLKDSLQFQQFGQVPGVAEAMFRQYDRDGSGEIKFDEFMETVKRKQTRGGGNNRRVPDDRIQTQPQNQQQHPIAQVIAAALEL